MASTLLKRSLAAISAAVLVAALAFGLVAAAVLDRVYGEANASSLESAALALAAALPPAAAEPGQAGAGPARDWCAAVAAASGFRVTLVLPDGSVLADSGADPGAMGDHGGRPEVRAALAGSAATSRRRSATLGQELLYAAAPVRRGGGAPVAALRLAEDLPSLSARLSRSRWILAAAAALFAAIALASALVFSRALSRPIARLAAAARGRLDESAQREAAGRRFRASLAPVAGLAFEGPSPDEYLVLADAMDALDAELASRIEAAAVQGRELAAILGSMSEGIMALDRGLGLKYANPAARRLLGLGDSARPGASILEAARSSELQALAAACLASGTPERREFALYDGPERWFRALASPLPAAAGGGLEGVVIVVDETTELRRLERVRRDFVANVSHELRTPVQVVKGFAESLLDGALGDRDRATRFVGLVRAAAERMEGLIADLLALARLEQEGGGWLSREPTPIAPVLEGARDSVMPLAEKRGIAIGTECEEGLEAEINAGLVEQAVANLLDNAAKYSPEGSGVRVEARSAEDPALGPAVVIEVRDRGPGIPARDLPRIFERFYRVDKARSRELGGTGLGLAIVRHIAMAHGGEARVESRYGEGSAFSLVLPREIPPGS